MPQTTLAQPTILRDNLSRFPLQFRYQHLNQLFINTVLPFTMEVQTQSRWCWAATAKSVAHFYSAMSPWTQCKIASSELNQNCCTTPVPDSGNVPWYLDRALQRTQNYERLQHGAIPVEEIQAQLERGLVIGVRIGWFGGGGHFVAIYGVTRVGSTDYLYIDDPVHQKTVLPYQQFVTNYLGSGSWTHTFFTKKFLYMPFKDLQFNTRLLQPLTEVRPLARYSAQRFNLSQQLEEAEFSTAHYTYIISLNDIHRDMNLPERPISLRVLEMEDSTPLAVYEVGLDETHPQFLQLNSSREYFASFESALELFRRAPHDGTLAELRHLRIPALNLEALWLHYDNIEQDRFVLVRSFDGMGARMLTRRELIEYLNARKEQVAQMDELMGAGE